VDRLSQEFQEEEQQISLGMRKHQPSHVEFPVSFQPYMPNSSRPPRSQQERNAARHENWGSALPELVWHMYASRGGVAASKQHVSHLQEELQLKLYHEAVDEIVQRGCGMCGG